MTDRHAVTAALQRGGIIDITTTGAQSGQPRRIEIVLFNLDGRLYISGMPGKRSWIANLAADPQLTVHLKKGLTADLPATARVIIDPDERRPIITAVTDAWNRSDRFEVFFEQAPLIEVTLEDASLLQAAAA